MRETLNSAASHLRNTAKVRRLKIADILIEHLDQPYEKSQEGKLKGVARDRSVLGNKVNRHLSSSGY